MNIKYTADGKKVSVIGQINNTDYIVQEIFVTEDGSEIPNGEKFVTKNLLDSPAKTWLEKMNDSLKIQESSLKKEIESSGNKLRSEQIKLDAISASVLGALKQKDFIDSELFDTSILANFLCGNVKYLVLDQYGRYEIVEMIERMTEIEYGRYDGLKLASILGKSDGSISYRIHQYGDISGGSYEVYPFNTLEDAKEKIKEMATERINKNSLSKGYFDELIKYGIEFDKNTLKKYENYQESQREKNIDYWKKQIGALQEKISKEKI